MPSPRCQASLRSSDHKCLTQSAPDQDQGQGTGKKSVGFLKWLHSLHRHTTITIQGGQPAVSMVHGSWTLFSSFSAYLGT